MLYKSAGIILKSMKYGESSLILDVLMKEKGMRSCIVSGVRVKKSTAAKYQIMNCLDFVAYEKNPEKLNRIKEANLNLIYKKLNGNIFKSSIGMFMMDVCRNAIREREGNEALFEFLVSWLRYLDHTDDTLAYLPCLFMIELTEHLGFQPQANYDETNTCFHIVDGLYYPSDTNSQYLVQPQHSQQIFQLQCSNREQGFSDLSFSKADRKQILSHLISFYKYHIEGFKQLKSLEILETILN